MPTNLWQPGESANPAGRLRGSRNKLSEEVICAFLRDFREHGQKAIARVRRAQPAAYLKICALLVPKEMKLEHYAGVKELTDEQLEQAISFIQAMLAAQAENTKVIEGTDEPAGLPVPKELKQPRPKRRARLLEHVDTAIGPSECGRREPQ